MTRADEQLRAALVALDEVAHRLRRECPWDCEQDERSIVPHTVEEAYELADAAHAGDYARLRDELGDVLYQVCFLALLLEERGEGDLSQVAREAREKLVRRHPHVFAGEHDADALADLPTNALTPAEVRENWDVLKRGEPSGSDDPLAGAPENLPALMYARKLQSRAAGGSDRTDPSEALARLHESVEEAGSAVAEEGPNPEAQERTEHGSERLYEAVGELLFKAVELARALQVDPEIALRRAGERFRAAPDAG